MIAETFKSLAIGIWELFNLGIEIDGFYLRFWYIPALFVLIDMILILIGFKEVGVKEKAGTGGKYKSKKEEIE